MHFHLLRLRLYNSKIWKRDPPGVDRRLPNGRRFRLTLTASAESSAALLACSDSLPISEP